jgi:hypothetical protein
LFQPFLEISLFEAKAYLCAAEIIQGEEAICAKAAFQSNLKQQLPNKGSEC